MPWSIKVFLLHGSSTLTTTICHHLRLNENDVIITRIQVKSKYHNTKPFGIIHFSEFIQNLGTSVCHSRASIPEPGLHILPMTHEPWNRHNPYFFASCPSHRTDRGDNWIHWRHPQLNLQWLTNSQFLCSNIFKCMNEVNANKHLWWNPGCIKLPIISFLILDWNIQLQCITSVIRSAFEGHSPQTPSRGSLSPVALTLTLCHQGLWRRHQLQGLWRLVLLHQSPCLCRHPCLQHRPLPRRSLPPWLPSF